MKPRNRFPSINPLIEKESRRRCYWFEISRAEGNRDKDVYRSCREGCKGLDMLCAFYFPKGAKYCNQRVDEEGEREEVEE